MWVWIDSITDTQTDKDKLMLIKNVIASVDSGYKGDDKDFGRLVGYFKSLFEVNKTIDTLSAAKDVKP